MDRRGPLREENLRNRDASLQFALLTLLLHRASGSTVKDSPEAYPFHEFDAQIQQQRLNTERLTQSPRVS